MNERTFGQQFWAFSSVGLEQNTHNVEVAGSSPARPTRSRIATLIVGRVTMPMMESESLPTKEVTNEFLSYLWWGWSWLNNVEVKPLVFRGNKLLQKPSYLWCNGAALIHLADM